jgi:hypothetical protein
VCVCVCVCVSVSTSLSIGRRARKRRHASMLSSRRGHETDVERKLVCAEKHHKLDVQRRRQGSMPCGMRKCQKRPTMTRQKRPIIWCIRMRKCQKRPTDLLYRQKRPMTRQKRPIIWCIRMRKCQKRPTICVAKHSNRTREHAHTTRRLSESYFMPVRCEQHRCACTGRRPIPILHGRGAPPTRARPLRAHARPRKSTFRV